MEMLPTEAHNLQAGHTEINTSVTAAPLPDQHVNNVVGTRPSSRSDNMSDGRHQWLWPAHPLGFIL